MRKESEERGFTVVELLVVSGIFVVVASITLARSTKFGSSITLETLAYNIALSVRQAQIYGIAVRRFSQTEDFGRGYGIHFDMASVSSGTPTYYLFADVLSGNGIYDEGELVQLTEIRGGYTISDLCVRPAGQVTETCGITELDILFKRPEPDAYIRANSIATLHEAGRVVLQSRNGETASIIIELSGQISVQ